MARTWQLQEAKSRFSEVVNEAIERGPQIVSRHGEEVVVILAYAEYKQMQKTQLPLDQFFLQSPLRGVEELDFTRDSSLPGPDIEL
jgi:prevent-host-death family protein